MDPLKLQTTFETDEYIFREGDSGNCAYIIDSGRVEVSLERESRKSVIATLSQGDILGEMAIIDRLPRTGSARAIEPTVVTEIPVDYFSHKLEQSDPIVRMFLRLVMARYRDVNARLRQVVGSLSPTRDPGLEDSDSSRTVELKNVTSYLVNMQKRIDSAVKKPSAQGNGQSPYSERTLEMTKLLVTEEKLLREAMSKKEFCLHYQPIIELANNRIVGCEALVRWNHPSGELIPPSRFLGHVEDSDLIIELGYWIAEEACRFQNQMSNAFQYDLFVAINLSAKQFEDPLLIPSLATIMDKTGAKRDQLKFEITESLLIDKPELATQSLHQLKETGARLAIDDFGTGYSSFSYLHSFPFDTLKIDQVFVSSMSRSRKSEQIVKSLINLSRDLGMDVVAEGIESGREAEMLRQYTNVYGQGFYFSKPVSQPDFVKLLRRPQSKLG